VTDLRRPWTWPVLGPAVAVWIHLIHGLVEAYVHQPASTVVDALPDDAPKTVQASVGGLVRIPLFGCVCTILVVLFALMPAAVFRAIPGGDFLGAVYIVFAAVIMSLSLPAFTITTGPHQRATTFEREDSERISEAQQRYVEGELTEDELEAELEAGLERGDE